MPKLAVLNVVGLTPRLLPLAPFLSSWARRHGMAHLVPVLPAVTCSVQTTLLTGTVPSRHGIVGNGWYFRDQAEIRFWHQSNRLVQAEKVWDRARKRIPGFTCANLFWWYNMYSSVDVAVTPRPMYPADGRKIPDIYTTPAGLRMTLQDKLGLFPLFEFWGPNTSIRSSEWIAKASLYVDVQTNPLLSLIYLPHLDYGLQRTPLRRAPTSATSATSAAPDCGLQHTSLRETPESPNERKPARGGSTEVGIAADVRAIDRVCEELIAHYEAQGTSVIVLSEYGITPVRRAISLNRILRREGFIAIREERKRERLDAGASRAFAVADHQIAHIYVADRDALDDVRMLVEGVEGIGQVLHGRARVSHGLDHERAGDLIAIADQDAWFTYYYWLDDDRAPDFARTVDIHRKPGYDPVELFFDPDLPSAKGKAAFRLMQRKLGFRALMDVIPLDPSLVGGSHGRLPDDPEDGPLLLSNRPDLLPFRQLHATGVHDLMLEHLL